MSQRPLSDTQHLDALIQALRRLPGVGVKSASRMAFHLLQHDREGAQVLARALQEAVAQVRHCARCHTFTESEICATCADPRRDASKLCVVETPADLPSAPQAAPASPNPGVLFINGMPYLPLGG